MGESPWGIHEAADSVPRYEWAWYAPEAGWRMQLSRAVAASACVPGVFTPLQSSLYATATTRGPFTHSAHRYSLSKL
jgi:hypothetical protein